MLMRRLYKKDERECCRQGRRKEQSVRGRLLGVSNAPSESVRCVSAEASVAAAQSHVSAPPPSGGARATNGIFSSVGISGR